MRVLFRLFGGGHIAGQQASFDQAVEYLKTGDRAAVLNLRRSRVARMSRASAQARDNLSASRLKTDTAGDSQPTSSSGTIVTSEVVFGLVLFVSCALFVYVCACFGQRRDKSAKLSNMIKGFDAVNIRTEVEF